MWAAARFPMSISIGTGVFAAELFGGHTIPIDFPTFGATSIKLASF